MTPSSKEKYFNPIASICSLATSIDGGPAPIATPLIRNIWERNLPEKLDLPSYRSGVQIDKIDHDTGTKDCILVNLRNIAYKVIQPDM